MEKVVKNFKKVARIIVVICLFVLAAFEIVSLVSGLNKSAFSNMTYLIQTFLKLLVYLIPAILIAVKKDKEGLVVLSFLLGYLVLANALDFLGYAEKIDFDGEIIVAIKNIIFFILGIFLALALICIYLNKGFKLKTMKVGNILLVISFFIILTGVVFSAIELIMYEASFKEILGSSVEALFIPAIIIFGLILVGDEK